MLPPSLRDSLTSLNQSIEETQSVITDLRLAINETENPIELRRYKSAIKRLKGYINEYLQEYQNLSQMFAANGQPIDVTMQQIPTQIQTLHTELQQLQNTVDQVNVKADRLVNEQKILYQSLTQIRYEFFSYYDTNEQRIIQTVVAALNQTQIELMRALLSSLDRVSESQMQQILSAIETRVLPTLPPATSEAVEIVKDSSLDIKHRLKVAIPLIPFIELESEFEWGTGMDLLAVVERVPGEIWKQVLAGLHRRR
ncbi:hypothetical protein H6G74_10045 [Nostoc spongiaeforme FACHB-130]|uniref:Chromosome partition protein Smc n=1 Tax=Nostoc spongiaeforme FACHB-130 TaxID=1357510 RepID=A0ABR8FTT6_9NOSO|nr:hypothetical protein [Nostoc spongiaeforme]MBD2594666.1 hypothetical protein [Nostoc spongiaeforme FACHB-130]